MPPKSIAMLALGKAAPEEDGAAPDDGLEMAVQDLMDALDAKDVGGAAAAFRSAVELSDRD